MTSVRLCACLLALLPAVLAGEAVLDNGRLRAGFVDPAEPGLGFRFIRAGWIRTLRRAGSGAEIVHTRTLFDFHPAFGVAQEMVPELELPDGRALKVGVGIVKPNRSNWFKSELVEAFPWEVARHGLRIEARQLSGEHAGYAYELRLGVGLEPGAPRLVFSQELTNTGRRPLRLESYLHPFFRTAYGLDSCRYVLPFRAGEAVVAAPRRPDGPRNVSAGAVPDGCRWLAAADLASGYLAVAASDTPLSRSVFWHNGLDCFAVEPYVAIELRPGETKRWKWFLAIKSL
ncbi:MAG: hypothetical protein HPZ91_15970 [Lentisphaeria bacterium]|nr:hypothetical protein [Lentisphaeria bacterium]